MFVTPAGSMAGGQPVDATATFAFSTNQLTITLNNLEANPISDSQNVNGVSFTLSNGLTIGTLSSSSADQRTITSTGAAASPPPARSRQTGTLSPRRRHSRSI